MAFEAVDACFGTPHISSDDLAALNEATIGKRDCVMRWGDDFKAVMTNANTCLVGTGVGMVGGKRFWNQAAVSLTVQSGTQGQKRNDLIVARYAKDGSGIESITPVVVKGTPTTGTPADPATTANDLKLWRVPLNGITVGAPVKLFSPVTPLATLGDSVSRVKDSVSRKSYSVSSSDGRISVDTCVEVAGMVYMAGHINASAYNWITATLTGCPLPLHETGVTYGRNSVWKSPSITGALGGNGVMIVQVSDVVSNNEIWSIVYLKA